MQTNVPYVEIELRMQRSLFDGYRPHLQVDDGEYLGISLFGVRPEAEAGQPHLAKAFLLYWPKVDYSSLKVGVEFEVKEGATTVGLGTVVRAWEAHAV